ncbi:MAG: methylenetetrahydrofolate reductase [NAD(P)H] [Spirochaetaceae bacterium]|nr:MAG: methylenetetrahydrofolate reductase [NAD(P)H] [Spirochaetaceae bacterium]
MHIADVYRRGGPAFSFEFFPPKTAKQAERLKQTTRDLVPLKPAAVSVTYGAGGTTRERTHDLVVDIQKENRLTVVSHLTCVGSTKDEIAGILDRYAESGIENIMALRGDPPDGGAFEPVPGGFRYASELVAFIKRRYPAMGVGVAGFPEGHPATPNRLQEIDYLKAKVDEGADYVCTQLFFDNHDFYDWRERCRLAGIHLPLVAGLMPITSRKGLSRMAELAAGSRFPARLLKAIYRAEDDAGVENVGVHWASAQVMDLIENGVDGVHFYTLNKSTATRRIYESLGVHSSDALSSRPV